MEKEQDCNMTWRVAQVLANLVHKRKARVQFLTTLQGRDVQFYKECSLKSRGRIIFKSYAQYTYYTVYCVQFSIHSAILYSEIWTNNTWKSCFVPKRIYRGHNFTVEIIPP